MGKGKSCHLVARSLLKVFRNHLKLAGFSRKLACRPPALGGNKRPEAGENVGRKSWDGKKQEGRLQLDRRAAFIAPCWPTTVFN